MSDRWHFIDIKKNIASDNISSAKECKSEPKPIVSFPHHQVRHNENAKKPPKHSLEHSVILDILKESCECARSCFHNFSVTDVESIRKYFDYLNNGEEKTENEISIALLHYLGSHSVPEKIEGSYKIGKKYYSLSFACHPGVYVCPTAFCRLIGICVKRLRNIAENESEYGTNIMDPVPEDHEKFSPKEDLICSFLEHVKLILTHKVKSELKDGSSFEYDSIIGFHEPKDLFNFYVSMIEDSVIPPSFTWFRAVWQKRFPNLHTSKDRPCVACNEFTHNMKEYTKKGDIPSCASERKRMEIHIGMVDER